MQNDLPPLIIFTKISSLLSQMSFKDELRKWTTNNLKVTGLYIFRRVLLFILQIFLFLLRKSQTERKTLPLY